jgi:RimJ/RimL family protein N-acetyltransferase
MIFNKIKYDGINNTVTNLLKAMYSLVYRTTYTVMLRQTKSSTDLLTDHRVKRFDGSKYNQSNLLNLPVTKFNKFEAKNAVTLILENKGVVAGYIVIHFSEYFVTGLGNIDLEAKKAAWVGPIFVSLEHRGQGINSALISSALALCVERQRVAYTSTNIDNIPSIRSFEKFGFSIVQIFKSKYMFNRLKITKVLKSDV